MSMSAAMSDDDRPVTLVVQLGDGQHREPAELRGIQGIRLMTGEPSLGAIMPDAQSRVFIVRSRLSLIPASTRNIERTAMAGDLSRVHSAAASAVDRALSCFSGAPEAVPFSADIGWARTIGALVSESTGISPTVETVSTARRAQIEYVVRCFSSDRRLTPGAIADALGVSRRTLYELAEPVFGGVSEYIRTTRALRASALLADPALAHVSVAEIARTAGFSSPRHMSRAVVAVTGLCPHELRPRNAVQTAGEDLASA